MATRRRHATRDELVQLVSREAHINQADVATVLDALTAHGVDVNALVKTTVDEPAGETSG